MIETGDGSGRCRGSASRLAPRERGRPRAGAIPGGGGRLLPAALAAMLLGGTVAEAQVSQPWSLAEAVRRNEERKKKRPALTLPEFVESLKPRVENIRGKPFKRDVPMEIIDRAAIETRFSKDVEDEATRAALAIEQRALIELGVLPEGADLAENHVASAVQHVAGFYDLTEKRFYVRADLPDDELRDTILHELTHALDDQHFDLQARRREAAGDADRSNALTAVVEGSAMLVNLLYYFQEIESGRMANPFVRRELRAAAEAAQARKRAREARESGEPEQKQEQEPPAGLDALQKGVLAPYALGLRFLIRGDPHALLRHNMDEYLDQVFEDPPLTTREILNPKIYFRREYEGRVAPDLLVRDLSELLGDGWERVAEGQLGEINVAILVELDEKKEFNPFDVRSWSGRASDGLVADTWHHYARGDETVTVLVTRWARVRDAAEFRDLLIPRVDRWTFYSDMMVCLVANADKQSATQLAAAAFSSARLAE